jgi:Fe-S-cluster containining protein
LTDVRASSELRADTAALTFRCTSCGECCRSLRVAVTSFDVARLVSTSGRSAAELVTWLAPDEVDMTGEPQSFVELAEGRRLMVLAHANGACQLLGSDHRCSVYAARPRDCRAFPFRFEPDERERNVRRLSLLPLRGCDYASDGQQDVATLDAEDRARWQELERYQRVVAEWNRRAWHRRRLMKRLGRSAEFLGYALTHS